VVDARAGLVTLAVGTTTVEAAADGFVGSEAVLCLRPEDVVLSLPGAAPLDSARNHLPGIVTRIAPEGAEARVELDCGFPLVARITRRSLGELALTAGAPVLASFKATALHLVPRASAED
jgi:molybdopterin-binding protein